MDQEKLNKWALQLREHSTGLIAILTDPEKSREYERGLTIKKIIENAVPMSTLSKTVPRSKIAQTIDIHLTRLVGNVNVSQNLNDSQIKTIVEDLMDKYPNESVQDFILVFKKARQCEFGTIYHLHSAVIFEWMDKYLEEKYQAIEDKLMREKDGHYVKPSVDDGPGRKAFDEYANKLAAEAKLKVPSMSDEDIKKFGQKEPHRSSVTAGYKYFNVRGVQIYAITQEHAEEQAQKLLKEGIIEEYEPE